MDLTPHVASLRDDLAAAAAVGDEATRRAGGALAAALEPAMRLALMNALSDLAAEVSENIEDHAVTLRLRGREVDVVVTKETPSEEGQQQPNGAFFAGPSSSPFASPGGSRFERPGFAPGSPFPGRPGAGPGGGPDMGDISRMTLRLVEGIKGQAEQAAASQGMSLNSWVAQAVQGALRDNLRHAHGSWGQERDPGRSERRDPGKDQGGNGGDDGVQGWVRG